jgi:dihydropyrimidine dehydrogenase (NAD+) subunit PreT
MTDATPGLHLETERGENVFDDFKPPYDKGHALAEAHRCLYCVDAPCISACPTGIDIPTFIRKIGTENIKGSAKTILDSNILGMSCARVCPVEVLCVGACVYNHMDQPPIQIGKLQRYATDAALEAGWQFHEAGPDTGKSVGLVGGGAASLAAAHKLRQYGHAVTIYEKRDVLGGLNTYGVAPYKLKADDAVEEIRWLLQIGGVEVVTGADVGTSPTWQELDERHDALFVGLGLGEDRILDIPGTDLDGVWGAVAHIEALKLGALPTEDATDVVVIGGGNTAIDCVREACGIFAAAGNADATVSMVYRGSEAAMSGYKHEWKLAKQEGARGVFGALPIEILGDADGKVRAVRCTKVDADKKPIAGSEFELPAGAVLFAVGQAKLGELAASLDGVQLQWGKIVVDEQGATTRPGLYAGGDCANGGKEVVNAVAEGRDAAVAIDAYLQGS